MARRHRRRAHKRNPTGTLLVNAGKRGRGKRAKRTKRVVSLAGLFSKVAKSNPRRHRRSKAGKRHNPRTRRVTRRSVRRSAARRRNPLAINPRRHRRHKRRGHKRNPLAINPRRGRRHAKRRGHKRNPIMINRRRGSRRRRNPDMLKGTLGKVQGFAKKVPLLGGMLATAVGFLGAAAGGAVGVLPISYLMPHVGKYMPSWLRPYGYTVAGAVLAAGVKALPVNVPYKNQLVVGIAAAGGAVDAYRWRHGKSQDLGDDVGGYYYGNDDVGDIGEYGDLSDGDPLAAVEWSGAALADADYAGDDLSAEEMASAELGRAVYLRRFPPRNARPPGAPHESSGHAGQPGERWGWLIYWIGFENFQKLAALPEEKRRAVIAQAKREAHAAARKLLSQQLDTGMTTAETAGLLVTA